MSEKTAEISGNSDGIRTTKGIKGSDFKKIQKALSDKYRIIRPIGRGAQATVFRCFDLELKTDVALKILQNGSE